MKHHSAEVFHENLVAQYRDMVEEAILESEFDYRTEIDTKVFDQKLSHIFKSAKVDGIAEQEVRNIINEVIMKHSELKAVG